MGGHNAGEVAAAMAIDTVEGFFTSFHNDPRQVWPYGVDRALSLAANLLRVGIKVANDKIREAANADRARARMGATVVAMAVGEKQVAIAHAGDSRAYRLRGGDAEAPDARPFDRRGDARRASGDDRRGAGRLRAPQRRHAQPGQQGRARARRLRQQGRRGRPLHVVHRRPVGLGARREDRDRSCTSTDDVEAACQLLVDAANEAGGPDNITVLLVRLG